MATINKIQLEIDNVILNSKITIDTDNLNKLKAYWTGWKEKEHLSVFGQSELNNYVFEVKQETNISKGANLCVVVEQGVKFVVRKKGDTSDKQITIEFTDGSLSKYGYDTIISEVEKVIADNKKLIDSNNEKLKS